MQRDMDLIRSILLGLEKRSSPFPQPLVIEGYSARQIAYHVKLLNEAGLIEAIGTSSWAGIDWQPASITWFGHEFLDQARDTATWEHAKSVVVERLGGLTIAGLQRILSDIAMQRLVS
jgi:hypothetical protein